jgi:hypothetical protein
MQKRQTQKNQTDVGSEKIVSKSDKPKPNAKCQDTSRDITRNMD